MITIQSGKLCIPDVDRFVGFAGDDSVMTKQLVLLNRASDSCTYSLCLRFDNDSVCTVPLTASVDGDDVVLSWEVRAEHLLQTGIVTAQLKTVDSDGSIAHSTKDFFIVGSSAELDDDGCEIEYVTPSQMRNSINQALETITATAPYIGDDGYWYVYDPEQGAYKKTGYTAGGIAPDSAMSDTSVNAVGNRYIKQYVDTACASKVSTTTTVAGLALTDNISSYSLADAVRGHLYRTGVIPNVTRGTTGQLGIGLNGEMFFCTATDVWRQLADFRSAEYKMDLIDEIDAADEDLVDNGNMYLMDNGVYIRYDDSGIKLAKSADVYSKSQIDSMVGNIEALLAVV